MHLFFADDAKQNNPTRMKMGPLIATGGLLVDGDQLASLETSLRLLCSSVGFPANEEFKWSPRRNTWMHHQLVAERRQTFFRDALQCCIQHQATATVIISETDSHTPADCATHEIFTTKMLLERVNLLAAAAHSNAIIIADRPGGGLAEERKFLADCFDTLRNGTPYVMPDRIAINPISTDSHMIRALQAADLIVSCTTAVVAGQTTLAPDVFEDIKPMIAQDSGRTGGVGVKIHPDHKYLNLYHWILGDEKWVKNMTGGILPDINWPYFTTSTVF
jgi:hypothetical protein